MIHQLSAHGQVWLAQKLLMIMLQQSVSREFNTTAVVWDVTKSVVSSIPSNGTLPELLASMGMIGDYCREPLDLVRTLYQS
jgi:hypothetical protein